MPGSRPQTTTTNSTNNGTSSNDFNNWLQGLTTSTGNTSGTSSNTGTTSSNNTNNVSMGGWAPAQGALQDVLTRAGGLSTSDAWSPYRSQTTESAINNLIGYANGPSAAAQAGQNIAQGATGGFQTGLGGLTGTATGGSLAGNPYMDAALKTGLDNTANRVNQQFSGAGRYGSAAHSGALARELGNIEANARLNNYNMERGYQNQAQNTLFGGGSLGLSAGGVADQARLGQIAALGQAGGMQDAFVQAQRQAPIQALDWYKGTVLPISGTGQSGSTTSQGVGSTSNTGSTSGTTSNTQNVSNNTGGTNNGVTTGNINQTQQVQQAMNPWGMIGGGALAGLGLMTGNPMLIGSGVSGMAGGAMGGGGGGGGSLWPSMFGGGSSGVSSPWATSVFPAG